MKGYRAAFWRRWARIGATRFPRWFVRGAPVVLGVFFFFLLRRQRAQIRRNLRRIHGVRGFLAESRDAGLTFIRFAQCLTEAMIESPPEAVAEYGRPLVEPLFEKGLIFLTAHLGPWNGNALILGEGNIEKLMLVMAAEDDRAAQEVTDSAHAVAQVVRLSGQPLDALPVLAHLRSGGLVALQVDRVPPGREFVETQLFGRPFRLPKGPFQLAALAQVPVVTVFASRVGFHQVRSDAGAPIYLPRRPTGEQLADAAQRVALELEAAIARYPTQWFHFVPDGDGA